MAIGTYEDLKKGVTVITASPTNIATGVENIRYRIYINEEKIVDHSNPKSETKIPQIIAIIKFKKK